MVLAGEEVGSLTAAPLAFQWGGSANYRSDGPCGGEHSRTGPDGLEWECPYREEVLMFIDPSIGLVLLLALVACIALAAATRYRTDHPLTDLMRWVHAHDWLDRLHHRH